MGGFFCPDTPFFSQLSEGIDLECKQHNYILNTLFLYEGDDIPKHLNMIKQNGAKGIILLGTQMQKLDISFFFTMSRSYCFAGQPARIPSLFLFPV